MKTPRQGGKCQRWAGAGSAGRDASPRRPAGSLRFKDAVFYIPKGLRPKARGCEATSYPGGAGAKRDLPRRGCGRGRSRMAASPASGQIPVPEPRARGIVLWDKGRGVVPTQGPHPLPSIHRVADAGLEIVFVQPDPGNEDRLVLHQFEDVSHFEGLDLRKIIPPRYGGEAASKLGR